MTKNAVTSNTLQAAVTAEGDNSALTAINLAETPAKSNGPARFPISTITVDDAIQQRARGVDQDLVAEYAADIAEWIDLAPVVIYWDGETRWLADGFHRIRAAGLAGLSDVPATVYDGGRRDAILYAARANQQHGLRRTNADKRRAVETLLSDPEWSAWTDNRIAAKVGVSQPFVSRMRGQLITVINCEPEADPVVAQVSTVDTCDPETQSSTTDTSAASAEICNERLREILADAHATRFAPRVDESTPKPEQPKPDKRIGRDGKAYTAPKPKPAPNQDHNRTRVALHAALAVTAALNGLVEVEKDLLEGDARTLMGNLTKALDRLAARFPVATTEGADNA